MIDQAELALFSFQNWVSELSSRRRNQLSDLDLMEIGLGGQKSVCHGTGYYRQVSLSAHRTCMASFIYASCLNVSEEIYGVTLQTFSNSLLIVRPLGS